MSNSDDDLFDDEPHQHPSFVPNQATARHSRQSSIQLEDRRAATPTNLPNYNQATSPYQSPYGHSRDASRQSFMQPGAFQTTPFNGTFTPQPNSYQGSYQGSYASNSYQGLSYQGLSNYDYTPGFGRKTVAFREKEPEFPELAYSPRKQLIDQNNQYELERIETLDNLTVPLRPYSQLLTFSGDDYILNELKDAEEDFDPFDEDNDSLFSDAEVEVKRGNTIKRGNTLLRRSTKRTTYETARANSPLGDPLFSSDLKNISDMIEEEDFKPRLAYSRTIKKARLINGNYIIDCPVPQALLDTYGKKISDGGREMSFMRYTAATCGPSNYTKFNYNLRQALYNPPRETELMVCITMYNEDEILLGRTLKGVFENIKNLTDRSDPCWGEDSWKKIVIVIVNDGRMELNERSKTLLTALGCYQDGYAKSKINDKSVKSHIYEYTSTVGIDVVNDKVHLTPNNNPVQFIFCLKEKNSRKINSHRWAFQAFGSILKPRVVMLLDCGTKPSKDAFFYLWRSFRDKDVAGACGEMRAALGPGKRLLGNPLVAAQNFEYKISNILDKPMESVFGFISVLPGAFSAYRYEALLNVNGEGPLEKYFKGEYLHQALSINEEEEDDERAIKERNYQEAGIFTSNMYLAEDRILCFELVAKKGHNYVLRYVNEAKAETDVPEQMDEFVLQRRRWLNGSLFAACYAVFHWNKIWKSNHSLLRKIFLQLEFYYQLVTITVSWFSLASFFLVFRILTANLGSVDMNFPVGKYLAIIFLWFYAGSVVCTFILAFGNTPRGTRKFYTTIAILFAIMMVYMLFSAIFLAVFTVRSVLKENKNNFQVVMLFTNSKFRDLVVSVVSTYTLYFFGAFLYGEPSFMFTSFIQYLLLSPSYINILNIYSFCNIHDVSWGTKGAPMAKDLGVAKLTGVNKDELVMIAPGIESNETYLNTLESLRTLPLEPARVNIKKAKDDSYYAFVRTITVLVWIVTNATLVAVVLDIGGIDLLTNTVAENKDGSIVGNSQVFLTIILWIVAGLAAFRFCGCVLYLMLKTMRPVKWWFRRSKSA